MKALIFGLLLLTSCQPTFALEANVRAYDDEDNLIGRTNYRIVGGVGPIGGWSYYEPNVENTHAQEVW